MLEWVQYTRTT